MRLQLKNATIVFDESHNIENSAEEAFTYKINMKSILYTKLNK